MAVPNYKSFINPILGFMLDKGKDNSVKLSEILDFLKKKFNPSPEDLQEQIKDGTPKFNHRMNWAVADLLHAKLVERVDRGVYRISDRGIQLLNENPDFDFHTLMEIPEYVEWIRPKVSEKTKMIKNQIESQEEDAETPQERIESLYKELETRTKEAILEKLKACDAERFENISLELLKKLDYGVGAIEHLGRSHDEGVDGVMNQDFLGLDKIYIQAKRYNKNTVDSSKIREFVGALEGSKSNKGVLLTTSSFTKDAMNWIRKLSNKTVVLIDGEKMADLMFQKNLGVEITKTYEIKKVSEDFFTEDIDVE
ncbi:MAG: restriction endonuclease [Candidatus Thermoplasmatota archaeon]|nr:restriction endonuclease [Candidatus Thermoplasmatota archaeon]